MAHYNLTLVYNNFSIKVFNPIIKMPALLVASQQQMHGINGEMGRVKIVCPFTSKIRIIALFDCKEKGIGALDTVDNSGK